MSLGNRSQMLLAACHGRRPSGRPQDAAAGVANSTAAARPHVFPLDDDVTLRIVIYMVKPVALKMVESRNGDSHRSQNVRARERLCLNLKRLPA